MNNEIREFTEKKVKELMNAATCCDDAKAVCEKWLESEGTDSEAEMNKALIAELEEDLIPIDGLISFAKSEMGAQVFGEKAPEVAAHGEKIKAEGARYCDCPACTIVAQILDKKAEILG